MSSSSSTRNGREASAEQGYRRRLRVGLAVGALVGTVFGLRSWLIADLHLDALVQLVASGLLGAIAFGLGHRLPVRWAERGSAAVLVAMTVLVCVVRGQFLPYVLVWNALIPLGLLTTGRPVRAELGVWVGVIVAATIGTYAATAGNPAPVVVGLDLNPVLSLAVFFPAVLGMAWMYERERERLQAEKVELERRQRVGAKMESVGRLAGGIAHDFNNLLAIISNYTELLGDEHTDRAAALEAIGEATKRGRQLTRQLLAVGGKGVRAPIALYPEDTIRASMQLLERTLPENVTLRWHAEREGWAVLADPTEIENVVLNLVINARDAMPKGGEISLRLSNAVVGRQRRPSDPDLPPGRYVEIEVTDAGIGMSTQLMDQIFDPFFTTKQKTTGSGLGLTSAYAAVRKLGGDMLVQSHLGQGSRFTVFLPVSDESADVMRRARRLTPYATEGTTVLLVEDEPEVRMATALLLRARGFQVVAAEDGKDAMRLFVKHRDKIDVVLTDLMMPGPSGVDVARSVRGLVPDMGIVFMSGYTDDPEVERFVAENGARFLRKPFSSEDLVAALSEVIATRQLIRHADGVA